MSNDISWLPVLLGWPVLLTALALSGLGLCRELPRYLFASAILIMPVSVYLAATPRFAFVALLAPLALLLAGQVLKHNQTALAIAMVAPVVLFFVWLAIALHW